MGLLLSLWFEFMIFWVRSKCPGSASVKSPIFPDFRDFCNFSSLWSKLSFNKKISQTIWPIISLHVQNYWLEMILHKINFSASRQTSDLANLEFLGLITGITITLDYFIFFWYCNFYLIIYFYLFIFYFLYFFINSYRSLYLSVILLYYCKVIKRPRLRLTQKACWSF